jgi:hypothetical protein
MFERKDGPVTVRAIKKTKTEGTFTVEFVQQCLRPLNSTGSLLNLMMMGNKSFGSPYQTRVAYQTMSQESINSFGLYEGAEFPAYMGARLVAHEFCAGDQIPATARASFNTVYKTAQYQPRKWVQNIEGVPTTRFEQPKMTPQVPNTEQQVLTRNGQPIYRNVYFSIQGMDQNDYLIIHTNSVSGSTMSIIQAAINSVGTADLPGEELQIESAVNQEVGSLDLPM